MLKFSVPVQFAAVVETADVVVVGVVQAVAVGVAYALAVGVIYRAVFGGRDHVAVRVMVIVIRHRR